MKSFACSIQQMHDEVSETENIRKNLSIERIIVGGCDILLDVNQVFVRQGNLVQFQSSGSGSSSGGTSSSLGAMGSRIQRSRFGSFRGGDKEIVRQCFLFTNHLLLCNRASSGKLNIVDVSLFLLGWMKRNYIISYQNQSLLLSQNIGRIPLSEATLIEDPGDQFQITSEPTVAGKHKMFYVPIVLITRAVRWVWLVSLINLLIHNQGNCMVLLTILFCFDYRSKCYNLDTSALKKILDQKIFTNHYYTIIS